MTKTCKHCQQPFAPRSHRARFCSDAHKVAWHRARTAIGKPPTASQEPRGGPVTIEPTADTPEAKIGPAVTIGISKPPPKGIVIDTRYPTMFRVVLPDGSLSDMTNLTRAKDALRALSAAL